MLCAVIILILVQYLLVLSAKHLKWPISCFQPILVAIFVTIAMVKVEFIRDLYILVV